MAGRTFNGRLTLAAACLALSGIAGAAGPDTTRSPMVWHRVEVVAEPGANQGMATRLDIVVVHDVALMPNMPRTAAEWLERRAALQAVAGRGLSVVSLEVPPASTIPAAKLPPGASRAAGALVYAGLASGGGGTAAALAPHRCVRIVLTQQLAQQRC